VIVSRSGRVQLATARKLIAAAPEEDLDAVERAQRRNLARARDRAGLPARRDLEEQNQQDDDQDDDQGAYTDVHVTSLRRG
jgi:hypothetical protein